MIRKNYIPLYAYEGMETKEMQIHPEEILARLAALQADVRYVKEHIEDVSLIEDDIESIKEAKKDLQEGKTKRL